ncbi:reprolysin-like metallopeptidase [Aurantibacillus circumpalustris]|uniref:reprolysin-like metallopeptidase n=1 Tax=Aurantibacillus circumpalustris TaxID=3036359 RepID=UPI00295B82AC|nr:zinc-dependent metalloprotease family protein [Aurantibacillus circumpalustris]
MKKFQAVLVAFVLLNTISLFSQNNNSTFWLPVIESSIRLTGARQIVPQKYTTNFLNGMELKDKLFSAPQEKHVRAENSECIIFLPLPNGSVQRFRVSESPVMAEELAAAFPNMKTFSVKGMDDVHATGKIDWNEFGFHARILSVNGDFYIDPYCIGNINDYISYYTFDFEKDPSQKISEVMPQDDGGSLDLLNGQKKLGVPFNPSSKTAAAACVGAQLRTYRLVIACTGEYAKAATGLQAPTVAQTLAKIITSVNRVNLVYEKEVSVRLVLVATETMVVFTDPATDPFNGNNNSNTLIGESQTIITNTIGSANFDIGHTFSTGGGGLAYPGVVCINSNKARGITGSGSPVGDPYDIDYVAHEIGHQFDGSHTFNAITGSCSGNRNASTSMEPGSGVTIMGYAGICSANNLATHSIANFHAVSYDEIVNFTNSGSGNSCPVIAATGNNPPVVTVAGNYTIPKGTPFVLTGSATDIDGDKLYYSWEEMDNGTGAGGNWNSGLKPYFRSYVPDSIAISATSYSRYFPKKSVVLSGNYTGTIGEYLPQTAQILKFRLTARDNKTGGGGVCSDIMNLTIDDAGPFTVTYPSIAGIIWAMGSQEMVVWDVNSTDQAPVSCDSVRVLISYDGGNTYSTLQYSTLNNGILNLTVPTLSATINTCRIKVEAAANIFYDISNNNFTISNGTPVNTVGIKQVSQVNSMGLNVWPNPFTNKLNFTVANLNAKNATQVKVIDVLGKIIQEYSYTNKSELKESIDLSGLNNGVYFIKVLNNNNQSVHRIVKD